MEKPPKSAPTPVRYLEIDETRAGQRLDNFLITQLKGVPKSRIYRLLRKGEVRVNRSRARPDYRIEAGDVVRLPPVRQATAEIKKPDARRFAWLADRILFEDEHLLALDKPAGMAVHGGSGVAVGLIEALRLLRPATRLELAHRLDRDTSGCLLLAKDRQALLALHAQLRAGEVEKRYHALVQGAWRGGTRRVAAALARDRVRAGERKVEVRETGKEAESRITPRQEYKIATLVEIELLTGRMHQARVHAAHIGHPIAGDDKYGDRDFNRRLRRLGLKRLFLHAASLRFRHPAGGGKMHIEAPLPSDLGAVLERLKHETSL